MKASPEQVDFLIWQYEESLDWEGVCECSTSAAGRGQLVGILNAPDYQAAACHSGATYGRNPNDTRLHEIETGPYRLPSQNGEFEVVVSTSAFEHTQNRTDYFREICRVLKRGGYAIHIQPSKWSLPSEPHIFVPRANVFLPNCPKWWLALWAKFGVRNEYQVGMLWRRVVALDVAYCATGCSYWSASRYQDLSMEKFEDYTRPMSFRIEHAGGDFNSLARRLPFRHFLGLGVAAVSHGIPDGSAIGLVKEHLHIDTVTHAYRQLFLHVSTGSSAQ